MMLSDLTRGQRLWAVQARFAWSERNRGAGSSLDIGAGDAQQLYTGFEDPESGWNRSFPIRGTGKPRCHPGCALIVNSPAFQRTGTILGFGTAVSMSQDEQVAGYCDTMALASAVMSTHGLSYALSDAEVVHYFNVSYDERVDLTDAKLADCRDRLKLLRVDPLARLPTGPWG